MIKTVFWIASLYCLPLGMDSALTPANAEFHKATTITGIFLERDGGASGSATGTFRLLTDGKIEEYSFEGPLDTDFKIADCTQAGAIWTVSARPGGRFTEYQVVRITCEGDYDPSVRSAVNLAGRFLRLLIAGNYRSAYELLHESDRTNLTYRKFLLDNKTLKLRPYKRFDAACLAVRSIDVARIVVSAGLECGLQRKDDPIEMELTLAKNVRGQWKLINVREVP
jgi:hypothetical protein